MMPVRLLASYLTDHLAAAAGGVALFQRAAAGVSRPEWREQLTALAAEVNADRDTLQALAADLEIEQSRLKQVVALAGERVGRLKPNGSLLSRTPLTDLVEIEGLRIAVAAKINGFQVLRAVAVQDERLDKETIDLLLDRAQDQADRLYRLHLMVAQELTVAA